MLPFAPLPTKTPPAGDQEARLPTPTTRRYPRSLAEAFPRTADYASAIESHRAPITRIADIGAATLLGVLGAIALVAWWSA